MNKEHESNLTIPYVEAGDYFFPNSTLHPDAGDIGFRGRSAERFYGNIVPSHSTSWCCPASCSSILFCSRAMLNPLHRLDMKNNDEAAAAVFDTIGTALYDLRGRIAEMQQSHLSETIRQGADRTTTMPDRIILPGILCFSGMT